MRVGASRPVTSAELAMLANGYILRQTKFVASCLQVLHKNCDQRAFSAELPCQAQERRNCSFAGFM